MTMKTVIPDELKGKELFAFLKSNKALLIAEKKYQNKWADAICYSKMLLTDKGEAVKANEPVGELSDPNIIQVMSVINTTNWLDSHKDVHIPGIWKKSLSENKELYLLEEHKMSFRGIITDKVKASTRKMSWRSLGVDIDGETEALLFNSTLDKARNEYMFNEYKNGHVKNHSVSMRYVKFDLAVNEPDDKYYREEYENWQKYIDQIANRAEAEEGGYFWPVTEAKVIEGSAVPIGSNIITPTLEVKTSTKNEPLPSTQDEPQSASFDISQAIKKTIFII